MRRLAIPALLALAGCAATPAIKTQIVEKQVPIPVPCVDKAKIPAEPAVIGILPPDARQAADLLGAKAKELRGWGQMQAALLQACTRD